MQIKIENLYPKQENESRFHHMQVSLNLSFHAVTKPFNSVAVPAMFDGPSFDPKYFMRDDITEQKIFHTRHPARKKFCGGRPGSPLYCDM